MQRNMDKIQFESRREIGELMDVIGKYIKAYPDEKNNQTLKRFYDLLDVMEMEW